MREKTYHLYLNEEERSRVIQSLIELKDNLAAQGRYTDAVDDVLCKVLEAKKNVKRSVISTQDAEKLEAADREADAAEGADNTEKIEAEDESAAEAAERRFRSYLLSNTRKGNELVMSEGEALERCALWALGTAYERETRVEKAIDVYGRLVEIEENREQIATAGIRKMKLEAGKEQYSIALLTGKRVLERTGTEPEVEKLMQEYELRIQEQESGVQNGQSREEQKKEEQKQEGEINEQNVDK